VLLQDGYDLLFRKPTTLHVLVLKLGQNELQTGLNPGGKVNSPQRRTVQLPTYMHLLYPGFTFEVQRGLVTD
jgi:hypothetical protein